MFCKKCGKQVANDSKFCKYCGTVLKDFETSSNNYEKPQKKKSNKKMIIIAIILWVVFIVIVNLNGNSENQESAIKKDMSSIDEIAEDDIEENSSLKAMDNELIANFKSACNEIGIIVDDIKQMEKLDDWAQGQRYSFTYKSNGFYAYFNGDSTVNSINIGLLNGVKLYSQGLNSLNAGNYILELEEANQLTVWAEETVKMFLKNPSSAVFPLWSGWGYGKRMDIYQVSGYVEAKNDLGNTSEIHFYIEYDKDGTALYGEVDGNIVIGKNSRVVEEERFEIAENADTQEIVLTDGLVGEYGKIVKVDSYDYIHYYVPVGKYKVIANTSNAMLYLDEDEYIKNSDGYSEAVNVMTLKFSQVGEEKELDVIEGTHILLVIGTKVTLIPLE